MNVIGAGGEFDMVTKDLSGEEGQEEVDLLRVQDLGDRLGVAQNV